MSEDPNQDPAAGENRPVETKKKKERIPALDARKIREEKAKKEEAKPRAGVSYKPMRGSDRVLRGQIKCEERKVEIDEDEIIIIHAHLAYLYKEADIRKLKKFKGI